MSEDHVSHPAPALTSSQRARIRARQKANRARKALRRERMFRLIVAGCGYADVARELDVSEATVRREMRRALEARKSDAPERYVALQVARLDRAMGLVDFAIEEGDLRAVPALLQLLGEYDRYEGVRATLNGRVAARSAAADALLRDSAPRRLESPEMKTESAPPAAAFAAPGTSAGTTAEG